MNLDHGKRFVYFDLVLQKEATGFFIESAFSTLYGELCAVFRQSLGPEANDRTVVPHSSIKYIREAEQEQPRPYELTDRQLGDVFSGLVQLRLQANRQGESDRAAELNALHAELMAQYIERIAP
ncbi:hypothetical protein ACGFXC_24135 [Streptomyces sp. NPDC048507]|uniref:hypothetical protein n=1 Tax=Streptomyces sp. NPDC048507 TaxID=3365560 RepID=UPI003710B6F2